MILQIFWVIFLMFIWFKTDAFTDYFSSLKSVKDWKQYKELSNPEISYPDFIFLKRQTFWRTYHMMCPDTFVKSI
jgi:hypothetical protein